MTLRELSQRQVWSGLLILVEPQVSPRASLLAQMVKNLLATQETVSLISPAEGNGYLLQYSCLENSMDRGAWWATVHGVAKSWT